MLDLNAKYGTASNQGLPKKTKSYPVLRKENSTRNLPPIKKSKYPTSSLTVVYIKKRNALQKGISSSELKIEKKKRKKKCILSLKSSRSSINKEIEEIENSIDCLTKKLEERRKYINNEKSRENSQTRQIFPYTAHSSSNYKLMNNYNDFRKRKFNTKNKVVTGITSHIHKYNNELERLRIKRSLEPLSTLRPYNITGLLSTSDNKPFQSALHSRRLKKMRERLDRVRVFIQSINNTEIRPATCSDGMSHKDSPQKKNSSTDPDGFSSEGAEIKGNDNYRNIQKLLKNRRVMNRNRLFASRAPLLETVIEEPEKEEEEAKLYQIL